MKIPFANPIKEPAAERLLILVFSPDEADFSDFLEIAEKIRQLSPSTAINIVTPKDSYDVISPARRKLPTLTVGIGTGFGRFLPERGAVKFARAVPKLEQFARF